MSSFFSLFFSFLFFYVLIRLFLGECCKGFNVSLEIKLRGVNFKFIVKKYYKLVLI